MTPSPWLRTRLGALYKSDAVEWLASLPEGSTRLIVADPPYDIGKASWDSFDSRSSYLDWTEVWIGHAHRVLASDGTLYVCGFPEPLTEITARVSKRFHSHRSLVWFYRNKANMGNDWGRSHEGLVHLRKGPSMVFNIDEVRIPYNRHTLRYPERSQATSSQYGGETGTSIRWRPNPKGARPKDVLEIPTLCNGSPEKTPHPTQKPEELIRRLVLASSNPGDLVIDPFGGSGTTYAVCEQIGRRWLGCERDAEYCRMISGRLKNPNRHRAWQAGETAEQRARRRGKLRGSA